MTDSDDIAQRRARLRALRDRYRSGEDWGHDAGPSTPPPLSPGRAEPAGAGGGKDARPLLERLRRYLIGPDGTVDEQHLQQVIQFLRRRAQDPSSPAYTRAQRLLQFLEGQGPGRERLMRLLQGRGNPRRAGGAASGPVQQQPSTVQTEDHERLMRLEEAVERLDRITQALAAHLDRPPRSRGHSSPASRAGANPDEDWFIDFLEEV
jgi:hypothetical protein